MPHKIIRSYPIGSLALLAILCGLLWRLEVEYQGWAGLKWVSYFHWAAPLASYDCSIQLFILIPFIPLGAYLIMRAFRMHLPWRILLLSMVGYLLAMPLSVWILEILDHKGGADVIHTIKSGVLIPFWVFALGWLVIKKRDTDKRISL
mgnify:CR=1 FL=1